MAVDLGDGSRVGAALLTVAALGVLAVGGWWWAASAPPPPPPAPAAPTPPPSDVGIIDPDTGAVSMGVDNALPTFPDTAARSAMPVEGNMTLFWDAPTEDGGRYLLQYVCVGEGELRIEIELPGGGTEELPPVSCGESFVSTEVVASGEHLSVRLRHPHDGHAELAVQLLALP